MTSLLLAPSGAFAPGRVARGSFSGFHEPDSAAHSNSRGKRMSLKRAGWTLAVSPEGVSVRVSPAFNAFKPD